MAELKAQEKSKLLQQHKKSILLQAEESENQKKQEKIQQLLEGNDIVSNDQSAAQIYKQQFSFYKKMQKQKVRDQLLHQAYEKQQKEQMELVGDPNQREFALSKSIGFD